MDETQNTDALEVETTDEETFEIEDDVEETDDSVEDEENSTQLHEELNRAKAENAKLQRLLKKQSKTETKKEVSEPKSDYVTKADLERVILSSKGLSEKQIEFAMKYGGSEALKDTYLKKAIDEIGVEEKQLSSTVSSTKGGTVVKKYSPTQIRNMPTEELERLIREGKIKNL